MPLSAEERNFRFLLELAPGEKPPVSLTPIPFMRERPVWGRLRNDSFEVTLMQNGHAA